jgi:hypothetical protein
VSELRPKALTLGGGIGAHGHPVLAWLSEREIVGTVVPASAAHGHRHLLAANCQVGACPAQIWDGSALRLRRALAQGELWLRVLRPDLGQDTASNVRRREVCRLLIRPFACQIRSPTPTHPDCVTHIRHVDHVRSNPRATPEAPTQCVRARETPGHSTVRTGPQWH